MTLAPDLLAAFAPSGRLRAAINLGNPILAGTAPGTGDPVGVSVDLARAFAQEAGLPLDLVVVDAAGKSVAAVGAGGADIGLFANGPVRGAGLAFTPPYVLIEGCYLVPDASPIQDHAAVDRAGVRVTVGRGSAYDLHLSRALQHAALVRAPTSPTVVDTFVAQGLEVAAGVRQQLEADQRRFPGHRLLDGHFMVIRQAMGVPRSRGGAAATHLAAFVERMKATGFVADALRRHGIEGAAVAPAEGGPAADPARAG